MLFNSRCNRVRSIVDLVDDRTDLGNDLNGTLCVDLNCLDLAANLFRRFSRLLGQFFHLVGNNCESFTGFTRARGVTEKPAAAWTAEQVVYFMLPALARGDFYILCPDNDVTRETDEKRMAWAMGDIIENRPALSRWHPDWKDRFEAFVKG